MMNIDKRGFLKTKDSLFFLRGHPLLSNFRGVLLGVFYSILPLAALLPFSSPDSAFGSSASGTIIRVIDGDSLLVNEGGTVVNVRLIGIDAPESADSPKAEKDAAYRHESLSEIFKSGKEAAKYLKDLVHPGESITLSTDIQAKDAYGRLLAYVYLPDHKLLNEKIIRAGFAIPMTIAPNVRFRKQIQTAYEFALKEKRGLWGKIIPAGQSLGNIRVKRRRYHRNQVHPLPGPQTEVTDQSDVSDLNDVSGKEGHYK